MPKIAKPSATQRGLGVEHQRERRRLLAALRDGDPCGLCGRAMYRDQAAHLDVDHEVPRALGGTGGPVRLTHRSCNRSAAAGVRSAVGRRRGRRGHVDPPPAVPSRPGWRRPDGGPVSRQWHAGVVWSDGEPPPDAPGRLGAPAEAWR